MTVRAGLALAFLLVGLFRPDGAGAVCRATALGTMACRPNAIEGDRRPIFPETRRLDPGGLETRPVPEARRQLRVPAARIDSFGNARLTPGEARRPGRAIEPGGEARFCRTDTLGNLVC